MKKTMLVLSLIASTVVGTHALAADENPFIATSTKAHKVTLLNHGMASLEQRLQMIERAQKSINVEYFIYRTDKSAKLITQALAKKARQGVKVRVLLDYFKGKSDFSPFYVHELEKSGAVVKYFNTVSFFKLASAQYRNHRKVLMIDDKEVLTGGRNVGDEYFDLSADYNFLDRDILVEGELVTPIKKTFDETFNAELSMPVPRPKMPDINDSIYKSHRDEIDSFQFDLDLRIWKNKVATAKDFIEQPLDIELEAAIRENGQIQLSKEYKGICNQMSFYSEYPDLGKLNRKTNRVVKHDFFNRINNAKESIMMESPYFIVNDELGLSMTSALDRNVNVRLMTNSLNSTDAVYNFAAFSNTVTKWLANGMDPYVYRGLKSKSYEVLENQAGKSRFGIHAKTFIFDHKDVVIGTYNIDPRSANYNSEMIVACENNVELASAVQENIDSRIDGAIRIDSKEAIKEGKSYQISFVKKLAYYISKGPSSWFDFLL